jgi:hypothetical protein
VSLKYTTYRGRITRLSALRSLPHPAVSPPHSVPNRARSISQPPNLRKASEGHVIWTASRKGVILQAFGNATAPNLIGKTVWDLSQDHPDLLTFFRNLRAGKEDTQYVEWTDGRRWLLEGHPTKERDRIVSWSGVSWLLEPDELPAPVEEPPLRRRVWEISGLLQPYDGVRNDDVIVQVAGRPGFGMNRTGTDRQLLAMHLEISHNMTLVEDTIEPFVPASGRHLSAL